MSFLDSGQILVRSSGLECAVCPCRDDDDVRILLNQILCIVCPAGRALRCVLSTCQLDDVVDECLTGSCPVTALAETDDIVNSRMILYVLQCFLDAFDLRLHVSDDLICLLCSAEDLTHVRDLGVNAIYCLFLIEDNDCYAEACELIVCFLREDRVSDDDVRIEAYDLFNVRCIDITDGLDRSSCFRIVAVIGASYELTFLAERENDLCAGRAAGYDLLRFFFDDSLLAIDVCQFNRIRTIFLLGACSFRLRLGRRLGFRLSLGLRLCSRLCSRLCLGLSCLRCSCRTCVLRLLLASAHDRHAQSKRQRKRERLCNFFHVRLHFRPFPIPEKN